jgi:hypothetical protein
LSEFIESFEVYYVVSLLIGGNSLILSNGRTVNISNYKQQQCSFCRSVKQYGCSVEQEILTAPSLRTNKPLNIVAKGHICFRCLYDQLLFQSKARKKYPYFFSLRIPAFLSLIYYIIQYQNEDRLQEFYDWIPDEVIQSIVYFHQSDRMLLANQGDMLASTLFWQGSTGSDCDIFVRLLKEMANHWSYFREHSVANTLKQSARAEMSIRVSPAIAAVENIRRKFAPISMIWE